MFENAGKIEKVDSLDLAAYISCKVAKKMSHLKLQKLLYYIESYHLAYFDRSIIEDDFQAWVHGPVSRKLYDSLKDKSILYDEIIYTVNERGPNPLEDIPKKISAEQLEIINTVIEVFGDMKGIDLEMLSHSEKPWIEAREGYSEGDKCEKNLSKETIRTYYKANLTRTANNNTA